MEQTAQSGIRVEREEQSSLAIIWNGGSAGGILGQLLLKQGLEVQFTQGSNDLNREPRYIFYFLRRTDSINQWTESLSFAIGLSARKQSKFFLIFINPDDLTKLEAERIIKEVGWPKMTVEIRSELENDAGKTAEIMGKIVRLAYSSSVKETVVLEDKSQQYLSVIVEESGATGESANWNEMPGGATEMLPGPAETGRKKKRKGKFGWWMLMIILFFLLPILTVLAELAAGIWGLQEAASDLRIEKYFEARNWAAFSEERFKSAEAIVQVAGPLSILPGAGQKMEKIFEVLHAGELVANSLSRMANVGPLALAIPKEILGTKGELDINQAGKQLVLEMTAIDQNLGIIDAEWGSGDFNFLREGAGVLGYREKFLQVPGKIKGYRQIIKNARALLSVLPEIVGNGGRKTYLVVFQNSAELRPTGGFIGSYAIVHFDDEKLLDYKINDVYTADGQLKGRVTPPDEILHYLGQPNWFMRDANFAADFPLSAKRLEWFLEKETGQNVDGVVAVNLGAVQKILEALGGVEISGQAEKITAKNFFQKAEFASEINFFAGSTQKRDFLGQTGEKILSQITQEQGQHDWLALAQNLALSLEQKDILFYFNSEPVQKTIQTNLWAGSILPSECKLSSYICLMMVEANFGANKANYYVKQSLEENFTISKGGDIINKAVLNIRNESPSESWPGGTYKNYLRRLAPAGSRLLGADMGDGRTASVSGVLTQQVLSKISGRQFLVYSNLEGLVDGGTATTSGYASFGTLVTTPAKSNSVVSFETQLPNKLDLSKKEVTLNIKILKQPGNNVDELNVRINFPAFLTPVLEEENGIRPIVSDQALGYNVDLLTDRTFKVKFIRE